MKGKQPKMVTARQFATLHGVPYTTVIFWLKREVIPGAEKQEIPVGRQGFIWRVPEDAPLPELPRGPKPKSDDQVATNGQAETPSDEAKPKRRVSKRPPTKKAMKKASK
jgi:hypothetical protein